MTPTEIEGTATEVKQTAGKKPRARRKAPAKRRSTAVAKVAPAAPPAPMSEVDAAMKLIGDAARDPKVDVEKLDRLLAMRRQLKDDAAKEEFFAAMRSAQEEMPQIVRDADNDHTKSKYAKLETISRAADPIIAKHGFSKSFGTADSPLGGHYRVTCVVGHSGGWSKDYFADIPVDATGPKGGANKTPTHAFGSTMTYGRRYLKCMIFDISLTDEDDDGVAAGEHTEIITGDELKQLMTIIEANGFTEVAVSKYAKVEALKFLPRSKFKALLTALQQRAAEASDSKSEEVVKDEVTPNDATQPGGGPLEGSPSTQDSAAGAVPSATPDAASEDQGSVPTTPGFSGAAADTIRNSLDALLGDTEGETQYQELLEKEKPKGRLRLALDMVAVWVRTSKKKGVTYGELQAKVEDIISGRFEI